MLAEYPCRLTLDFTSNPSQGNRNCLSSSIVDQCRTLCQSLGFTLCMRISIAFLAIDQKIARSLADLPVCDWALPFMAVSTAAFVCAAVVINHAYSLIQQSSPASAFCSPRDCSLAQSPSGDSKSRLNSSLSNSVRVLPSLRYTHNPLPSLFLTKSYRLGPETGELSHI